MARVKHQYPQEGFYGIGLLNTVNQDNIGTLWRSAYIMGASFIFTIGKAYKRQGSDVNQAWTKIPLYHYDSFADFQNNIPYDTRIIAVEMDDKAIPLKDYPHPMRAVYLLGNEQAGIAPKIIKQCHSLIELPGSFSLNVSVTGSLVMYDRISKIPHSLP